MSYQIKIDQFEGPLPLLLELIKKEKLDITELSLAKVTDDFLLYLEEKENINLNNLSEFLSIASQLILIKSKALLPFFELTVEEEEEVQGLEERLKEYRRFQEVSKKIGVNLSEEKSCFMTRRLEKPPVEMSNMDITKDDLKNYFKDFLKRKEEERKAVSQLEEETWQEVISLEDKIGELRKKIRQRAKLTFRDMIKKSKGKLDVIVSFLAVLEMLKQGTINVRQEKNFGEIVIKRQGSKK